MLGVNAKSLSTIGFEPIMLRIIIAGLHSRLGTDYFLAQIRHSFRRISTYSCGRGDVSSAANKSGWVLGGAEVSFLVF